MRALGRGADVAGWASVVLRMVAVVIAVLAGAAGPAMAEAVEVRVEVRSEVKGHVVAAAPRVLVRDDTEATITIQGGDTALNGTPVPASGGKAAQYVMRLTIRPRMQGGNPRVLSVRLSLELTHKKQSQRRTFVLTALEGQPTDLEFEDKDRQELTRLTVTAFVRD